eukprot:CAMPEP_0198592178 /NCGR_PEP_ID=MMETSP1462-20131121/137798_1 /TAXON_ID=1333877 /ORGANISM="Brandtodinium nutriculum, Strain RCC3387" /LENGTH=140 /DNA_ID=CAMNT_0044323753 /DNA_START=89 /DNA_END=507 /DNA_ORIENTATION=+
MSTAYAEIKCQDKCFSQRIYAMFHEFWHRIQAKFRIAAIRQLDWDGASNEFRPAAEAPQASPAVQRSLAASASKLKRRHRQARAEKPRNAPETGDNILANSRRRLVPEEFGGAPTQHIRLYRALNTNVGHERKEEHLRGP